MKDKKKVIVLVIVIILAIAIAILGYIFTRTNNSDSNKEERINFSEHIKVDDISNLQENLVQKNTYVKYLNKDCNSYIIDSKFFDYSGQTFFYREENEIKANTFSTVLCSKTEDIEKYCSEFIGKCIEYIGEYTEYTESMLVVDEKIKEEDKYNDIVNGRSIYHIFVDVNNELYIIDIYAQGKNIIAQFSYSMDITEDIPENGVG